MSAVQAYVPVATHPLIPLSEYATASERQSLPSQAWRLVTMTTETHHQQHTC